MLIDFLEVTIANKWQNWDLNPGNLIPEFELQLVTAVL